LRRCLRHDRDRAHSEHAPDMAGNAQKILHVIHHRRA
jgi:hypothetical protein